MSSDHSFTPAYLSLLRSGELDARVEEALARLAACDLCPRYCRVDRRDSIKGALCHTGARAVVHSYGPHHGEEDPPRGTHGSGTVFFAWCNLRCVYCQNWNISQKGIGREVSTDELAGMMLELQAMGCHNVNLVSPSHVVAQIVAAVRIAAEKGLRLPLVYNTGGYDSLEALSLLDGIVDIYMPDLKYADAENARRYSRARDYVAVNRAAVPECRRARDTFRDIQVPKMTALGDSLWAPVRPASVALRRHLRKLDAGVAPLPQIMEWSAPLPNEPEAGTIVDSCKRSR